jgi:hypothetical protein
MIMWREDRKKPVSSTALTMKYSLALAWILAKYGRNARAEQVLTRLKKLEERG